MDETIKTETNAVISENKDDVIYRLIGEKKEIEAKNKRMASILEMVTKKIANTDNNANSTNNVTGNEKIENSNSNSTYDQIIILKKHINALKSTIEKTNNDEIKQLNETLTEFKLRFDAIESKLSGIDKIEKIENKLTDIENSIILRKRSTDNPFGMLGTIGKGKEQEHKKEKVSDKTSQVHERITKSDINTKSIEPFVDVKESKKQKKDTKLETISNISEGMKHLAEKFM